MFELCIQSLRRTERGPDHENDDLRHCSRPGKYTQPLRIDRDQCSGIHERGNHPRNNTRPAGLSSLSVPTLKPLRSICAVRDRKTDTDGEVDQVRVDRRPYFRYPRAPGKFSPMPSARRVFRSRKRTSSGVLRLSDARAFQGSRITPSRGSFA